jgi:DNA-nicking Smr family endonuclease
MAEAKGLILNAAFLQEVYNNKPVSEIASLCTPGGITLDNLEFKKSLPFFYDGLFACSTKENMSAFLRTKLTPTFVAQTSQAKKQAQNYVDYISSSWGEQGNEKGSASNSEEIEIVFVDSDSHEKTTLKIGSASTLKALFNQYAEDRGVSLRSLRFSYDDKTLFLSSIGQKTPNDLCIKNLDMIIVTEQKQASPVPTNNDKTKANRRGSNSAGSAGMGRRKTVDDGKPRKNRRASWTGCPVDTSSEEFLKLRHSRKLTRLFEEAEPIFNKIRQELNDLIIQRSKPKRRITTSRPAPVIAEPICNPVSEGLGGKAGKVFFNVNVGQVENLYKTSKTGVSSHRFRLSVDLHGYSKDEAVAKLDDCLPEWRDTAMRGEYPWVIPVEIVCGGGSQILSETVERWIKENDGVANAPKNNLNRRRITLA